VIENKLPLKTLILWQIRILFLFAFLIAVLDLFCNNFDWCVLCIIALGCIYFILSLWYIPTLFKSYKITYINGAVVIEKGVIVKTTNIMPYSKMIYTQTITTPLARVFGLSAVALKAARSRIIIPEFPVAEVEKFAKLLAEGEK